MMTNKLLTTIDLGMLSAVAQFKERVYKEKAEIDCHCIMFDLFKNMREVDKQLADELLKPTIAFLVAQADGNRMKPMNLKESFAYRDADLGKG